MKLMIAGCSFSSVSESHPGTSWSEIMAHELGWELENFAREGCSNGGIRIVIDEIRRQRPDFAVITPTFWDRMEIPARAAPYDWSTAKTAWDPPLQRHLQNREIKNGYDREDVINNVNYGHNNYRMICETIFSLAENYPNRFRHGDLDKDTQRALQIYIDCIYDNAWKKQMDEWIITQGLLQLHLEGIKFLVVPCLLWPWDAHNEKCWREAIPEVIPDHSVVLEEPMSPLRICGAHPFDDADPGYHSSPQGQKVIAQNYLAYMQRQNVIS